MNNLILLQDDSYNGSDRTLLNAPSINVFSFSVMTWSQDQAT